MRVKESLRLTALITVILAGCAPAAIAPTPEMSPAGTTAAGSTVHVESAGPVVLPLLGNFDEVWKALPAAFNSLRIPADVLDAQSHVYGNTKVVQSTIAGQEVRDLFRCAAGAGLTITDYRVEFGVTAQPHQVKDGTTELVIQTSALGRLTSPSRSGTTGCMSNGRIEQILQRQVQVEIEKARR